MKETCKNCKWCDVKKWYEFNKEKIGYFCLKDFPYPLPTEKDDFCGQFKKVKIKIDK